jgi:glutamyl-tRNA synthetase
MSTMKLRFAPSPTGYLHVGNARIALANALFARRESGDLLLRLDDTDRERSRPEYEDAIRQDLGWLGIAWNQSFRQADRTALYEAAADRLKAAFRLYPCFESEEELRSKRDMQLKRRQAPIYDRAMLRMTPAQRAQAEAGGKRPYWRFKLSDGTVAWNDLVLGERQVKLGAVSDPVVIRADGTFLYTFTSVVDDLDTGITHIVRGEDHVTNTGVQLDLARALGAEAGNIRFAHLPLLVDSDGGKLSKRLEGLSLRSLRQDGMEPRRLSRAPGHGAVARAAALRPPRRQLRFREHLPLRRPVRHDPVAGPEPQDFARGAVRSRGGKASPRRHAGILARRAGQPGSAHRSPPMVGCGRRRHRAARPG